MNLNNIREGGVKDVLGVLERAFKALDIDYYLIGAIARDIWYSASDVQLRTTKDIDFAILVGSNEQYQQVKQYLINEEGFSDSKENAFVVISPGKVEVDILPFGEIAMDDGVRIEGMGLTHIGIDGFWEVHQAGTEEVALSTGHHFKVATLASIVLLKLIAFDDRPERRSKDPRDIANIIRHYFELQSELIYDRHADLFTRIDDIPLEEIAAIVIGREIKTIIVGNETLYNRILAIVAGHVEQAEKSAFVRNMVGESGEDVVTVVKWLNGIAEGVL
ncbi:hypothetical protein GFS24_17620 [Chitinophaga sp. SYP-B3965]|uniref:nucleotidyl transferase AbiEii/AbiGii toxin family protein n=1 Tax=Chitinophaga sp. SYP-B3965 TaxID=2663120 RepID=UPI00129966E6|nr:nucleotidyl transferase AbiEii/AbiGii toxin family protein [Chitinophaga sp. SYP-B3965]MRG46945.1 hypothetical protein [Chitinophaga sp. SYP-B3965]